MARIGNGPFRERQCFITWDDPDYLSNEFVLNLLENASEVHTRVEDKEYYGFWGFVFGHIEFCLSIWCTEIEGNCTFDRGCFSIKFGSYKYPEHCFTNYINGHWDILETKWLLDEEASKRIWSLYKQYEKCSNIQQTK